MASAPWIAFFRNLNTCFSLGCLKSKITYLWAKEWRVWKKGWESSPCRFLAQTCYFPMLLFNERLRPLSLLIIFNLRSPSCWIGHLFPYCFTPSCPVLDIGVLKKIKTWTILALPLTMTESHKIHCGPLFKSVKSYTVLFRRSFHDKTSHWSRSNSQRRDLIWPCCCLRKSQKENFSLSFLTHLLSAEVCRCLINLLMRSRRNCCAHHERASATTVAIRPVTSWSQTCWDSMRGLKSLKTQGILWYDTLPW